MPAPGIKSPVDDGPATCVEDKAGVAGQPEHSCLLVEARDRPELDPALESAFAEASGRLSSTWPRTWPEVPPLMWYTCERVS